MAGGRQSVGIDDQTVGVGNSHVKMISWRDDWALGER
jgi:hypothetical protein